MAFVEQESKILEKEDQKRYNYNENMKKVCVVMMCCIALLSSAICCCLFITSVIFCIFVVGALHKYVLQYSPLCCMHFFFNSDVIQDEVLGCSTYINISYNTNGLYKGRLQVGT